MKLYNAAEFLNMYELLGKFYRSKVFPDLRLISIIVRGRRNRLWGKREVPNADERKELDDLFADFESECLALGLAGSVATLRKMRDRISEPGSSHGEYWAYGKELQERLVDEMNGRFFLSLSLSEAEYYNNSRQKWAEVIEAFPSSESDIEEAGKCFAFGRYAASVFHSLQVVEVGVIGLGKLIDVSDHHVGWTATTNKLESILKKKHQDRTEFQKANIDFIEQMHVTVVSLKNAWRNKVSHVHNKLVVMTSDFGPDVAEEILLASRAFMRRLATDEVVAKAALFPASSVIPFVAPPP